MSLFDRFKGKKNLDPVGEKPVEESQQPLTETSQPPSVRPDNEADTADKAKKSGFFEKFKNGLTKTRKNITERIESLIKISKNLDDDFWEELEEILIQADCGVNVAVTMVQDMKTAARKNRIDDPNQVMGLLQDEVIKLLGQDDVPLNIPRDTLAIVLVVGVNGSGKTTSIAKLAHRFKNEGLRVMLSAGDTFRAAAIDQLQIWADRIGVELIKHQEGADPGAVVYDSLNAAKARRADILIIDTAGRLQNKANLMKEIGKVRKVIEKEIPEAPHEVLLVLDATTGQNAISQARIFGEATGVTGIVLTKLDGTAKGGIVLGVAKELDIPVKLVGIGEGLEDLRDFAPDIFARALFAEN